MTVTTNTNKQFANGDGATQTFYFYYRLELATDLQIYVDGVQLAPLTGYTVSINPNGYGGSVTFAVAPDAGTLNVLIAREVDYLQDTHFPNENDFDQVSLEDTVDKLAMGEQQLQEEISRAVLWNITVPNVPNLELPVPVQGEVIGWGMVPAPSPPGGLEVGLVNLPNIGTGPAGPTGATGAPGPTGPTGAASSGAMIPLQTQTVSSAGSVVFTGIDNTYPQYIIQYNNVTYSITNTFYMQISEDGGTTWKTPNYSYSTLQTNGSTASSTNTLGVNIINAQYTELAGSITFWYPYSSLVKLFQISNSFWWAGAGLAYQEISSATYNGDTGAFNAVQFFPSTGTISGTFTLFGITNTPGDTGRGPTGPTGPAGPTGTTTYASISGATVVYGNNVASVTHPSTGVYAILFTTPMTDANFVVTANPTTSEPYTLTPQGLGVNGFTMYAYNPSGALVDVPFNFIVAGT